MILRGGKSEGGLPIVSFSTDALAAILEERPPGRRFPSDLIGVTKRKLVMLNNARSPDDLRHPGGNRFEVLRGDRVGQFSIRVNDQYRLCFGWSDAGPTNVEFVDYH